MNFWGKLICGFFGFLLAGPVGMLFGIFIGQFFDRGLRYQWQTSFGQQATAQQAFFNATFLVMGYVSKADGRVSEAEIQMARNVMDRMGLNDTQRQRAIELFNQGKQPNFNLDAALTQLIQACHRNKVLLRIFVETQMQAAQADGHLSATQQQVLQRICQRLGFAPLNFSFFEDLFNFQRNYQQNYQHQQGYQPRQQTQLNLRDAYTVLGIKETATDAELKRAYRRLMSQHHPDKLVSKGLPEEMMKLATEKAQNIKAAYERICDARGMK